MVDRGSRMEPPRVELRGSSAVVHVDLTGPGGGDLTLRVVEGRLRISRGAPRPAQSAVTLRAALFLDLLAGRADFAGAQIAGRVRIDGQPFGGLMLAGVIATFRAAASAKGFRGVAARGLLRWVSK
jgi:hypothetical protein